MSTFTVIVDAGAPADGAFVPEDDGSVLLLNPHQSFESLVDVATSLVPGITDSQARSLIRRHVPDAWTVSSVTAARLPAPRVEPVPESGLRRRFAVSVLLGSVLLVPMAGYVAQGHVATAQTVTQLRALLTDFGVKCWGDVQYETTMRCVVENDATRVTVTQTETTGTVMLLETDHEASMVVLMESPEAAASAVGKGIGRMLVGDQPTAIGRYVVTSTSPRMQTVLEQRARVADNQPVAPAPRSLGAVALPTPARSVPVSRATSRPFLDGIPLGVSPFAPHEEHPPSVKAKGKGNDRPRPSQGPASLPLPVPLPAPSVPVPQLPAPVPSLPLPAPVPTPTPAPTPPPPTPTPTSTPAPAPMEAPIEPSSVLVSSATDLSDSLVGTS